MHSNSLDLEGAIDTALGLTILYMLCTCSWFRFPNQSWWGCLDTECLKSTAASLEDWRKFWGEDRTVFGKSPSGNWRSQKETWGEERKEDEKKEHQKEAKAAEVRKWMECSLTEPVIQPITPASHPHQWLKVRLVYFIPSPQNWNCKMTHRKPGNIPVHRKSGEGTVTTCGCSRSELKA